jgi:hypothetical protein
MLVQQCTAHPKAGTSIHGRCNECDRQVVESKALSNRKWRKTEVQNGKAE